jgi:hypothetical protein
MILFKNLIDLKKYGSPDLVSFFQNMADCVNFKKNSSRLRQFDEKKVAFDLEY